MTLAVLKPAPVYIDMRVTLPALGIAPVQLAGKSPKAKALALRRAAAGLLLIADEIHAGPA